MVGGAFLVRWGTDPGTNRDPLIDGSAPAHIVCAGNPGDYPNGLEELRGEGPFQIGTSYLRRKHELAMWQMASRSVVAKFQRNGGLVGGEALSANRRESNAMHQAQ